MTVVSAAGAAVSWSFVHPDLKEELEAMKILRIEHC